MSTIDIQTIKDNYDKNWLTELKSDYFKMSSKATPKASDFFSNPKRALGFYGGQGSDRNKGQAPVADYLERLLYAPNIAVLDFVLKNRSHLQDLKFIDNGCGLGILSVFLQKIGIECYNYDNFSQLGKIEKNIPIDFYKKYKVGAPKTQIPLNIIKASSVLISCGIWVDYNDLKKKTFDYFLMDTNFLTKPRIARTKLNFNNYKSTENYKGLLTVYVKK